MKFIYSIISILFITAIFSCDKIDNPYPPSEEVDTSGIVWDDSVKAKSNEGVRYVLMEEYTGHKCTNCPRGAKAIEDLKAGYGDKFIPIATHIIDAFAAPGDIGGPAGSYTSDYRTDEGLVYETTFNIAGLPGGTVSRRNFPVVTDGVWGEEAQEIYRDPGPTVANLHLTAFYDQSKGTYRVRVIVEWLIDYTDGLNLQVQMLEDSIADWQLDNGQHIPPFDPATQTGYMHRHMFRGSVNTVWGEPMKDAAAVNDMDTMIYTREFDPPSVKFPEGRSIKDKDVSFVAFLYKDASDGYEVMQVNEVHLMNHP